MMQIYLIEASGSKTVDAKHKGTSSNKGRGHEEDMVVDLMNDGSAHKLKGIEGAVPWVWLRERIQRLQLLCEKMRFRNELEGQVIVPI